MFQDQLEELVHQQLFGYSNEETNSEINHASEEDDMPF